MSLVSVERPEPTGVRWPWLFAIDGAAGSMWTPLRNDNMQSRRSQNRSSIAIPFLIIAVGLGWLLTSHHIIPGVDWIWILGMGVVGVGLQRLFYAHQNPKAEPFKSHGGEL